MNSKGVITNIDVFLHGFIKLNKMTGRRAISIDEWKIILQRVLTKIYDNINFNYDDNDELKDIINEYFDVVEIQTKKFYRLKPMYSIINLKDILRGKLTVEKAKIFSDDALIENLCDMTYEEEQNCPEFMRLDEKYQLETIYKIAHLEKERRVLAQKLGFIEVNSSEIIDNKVALEYLENHDVTFPEFQEKFGR